MAEPVVDQAALDAAKNSLEPEQVEKVPEDQRSPAQKRIIQLVSQKKAEAASRVAAEQRALDAEAKLQAKEQAETKAADEARLANAKTKADFDKIAADIQKKADDKTAEYEARMTAQQERVMERAAKMVLQSLAIQGGMTNPDYIRLFDCEVEVDPDTLEVTAEGMKSLKADFDAFKKSNPTLFGKEARQTVVSPDGKPARILSAVDKFDKGMAKEMSPIELIAAGLAKQNAGR